MDNSQKLHLSKAVTWRIIASITTALIALSFGLPQKAVAGVFVADLIIKFILYYGHERMWYNLAKLFENDQKGNS
mgnify:CR=1 FL=1|jgi:uncharacterized membrane protein|tara:strand:- start:744 stop:968 length:225 start_codon:yes stop_codon:yes gene_type:complete